MIKHNLGDLNKMLNSYLDDIQEDIVQLAESIADDVVKKL